MGNYLVTGGAGFIGSHFVRMLLADAGERVTNLDKLTYAGDLRNLSDLRNNKRYRFVRGDIRSPSVTSPLVKAHDCVVNFAAESHVDRSIEGAGVFLKTDVEGTFTLLEAARRYDKRFVQVSTDEVYGSRMEGSFREADYLNPSSPYSASKAAADLLVHAYQTTYGLSTLVTRSSNNYGPNQHPEKLIPRLILSALRGKPLQLYGDGLNVREWLFVTDNCQAIKTVIEGGRWGEIFNIGSGVEKTNLEVAEAVLKELGKPHSMIRFVKDRPGHDRRYSIDSSKVRALGWSPTISLKRGIAMTVAWYAANAAWWRGKL